MIRHCHTPKEAAGLGRDKVNAVRARPGVNLELLCERAVRQDDNLEVLIHEGMVSCKWRSWIAGMRTWKPAS